MEKISNDIGPKVESLANEFQNIESFKSECISPVIDTVSELTTRQLALTTLEATIPQPALKKPAAHVAMPQLPKRDRTCTFCVRQLKKATKNSGRECLQADVRFVEKVLERLDIRCEIVDLIRLRKFDSSKQRSALVIVDTPRNPSKILVSAGKLKEFTLACNAAFISSDYTPDEKK